MLVVVLKGRLLSDEIQPKITEENKWKKEREERGFRVEPTIDPSLKMCGSNIADERITPE